MATIPVGKLSYSKVASSGKENNPLTFARVAAAANAPRVVNTSKQPTSKPRALKEERQDENLNMESTSKYSINHSGLDDAMKEINLRGPGPSLVVNGSGDFSSSSQGASAETSPDDPFQRTDSGSELGTKPPSIDGKSITSGTTFALDEKESLRPDDSASVKAAEDDDTFSGRGSIVAGSRISSEAAARAYRSQNFDVTDRRAMVQNSDPQNQGILTPQSSSSGQQVVDAHSLKPLVVSSRPEEGFNLFYKQTPDEKLLEALDSPKDRIFLLRLEQDLISFVKDSTEPFIDLPPCNSFCRLLTHKLADYYHMTHTYDKDTGSVRIFRTPFCRLPETLTSISNPPTSGNTPPPAMPTMKIMRRGGDENTGGSPSKTTSEVGSDGKEKGMSAKEKLSREEREAAYNKARERIFGNSTGDATPDTDEGNNMSRSSSMSAKERSGQGKRGKPGKQRRDDSESFDVRSQYTPFFPPQQQQAWAPLQQYNPMSVPQFGSIMQPAYTGTSQLSYGQTLQQFQPGIMPGIGVSPYNQMGQPQVQMQQGNMPPNQMTQHQMLSSNQMISPQIPHNQMMHTQMPQQFIGRMPPNYQPHSAPNTTYGSPIQTPPQQAAQQWPQQNAYQTSYQSRGPTHAMPTIPYLYGQLPSTANPADPKSQHPIPGSFNRHAFNPKTQSFVPGNNGMPSQPSMSHHGSPHLAYNVFPTSQQYNGGLGYNMSRQGSNTSLPSYHASPHSTSRPMMHPGMPPAGSNGSHLPHFGNSATLPPKPPPAV